MPCQQYEQHQMELLPASLEELIADDDLCWAVDYFVEKRLGREIDHIFDHAGGGRPAFHPRMMLKILLYAYSRGIRSSRKIAAVVRREVPFMWLAARKKPSFPTVNRFRSRYLAPYLESYLGRFLTMLVKEGYVREEDYFVDGTVVAADVGRTTYVWAKNTKRFRKQAQERAAKMLREAAEADRVEDEAYGPKGDLPENRNVSGWSKEDIQRRARGEDKPSNKAEAEPSETEQEESKAPAEGEAEAEAHREIDPSRLTSDELRRIADELERRGAPESRKRARQLREEAEKLAKYEEQTRLLDGRNSYSKTDPDATFMRNKQKLLRGGYNLQTGTQDGFVTGLSLHQTTNDGAAFVDHMESRLRMDLAPPATVVADGAYGTEENYRWTEEHGIEAYLKYPHQHRESKGKLKPYESAAFAYDEATDTCICPQGRKLVFRDEFERVNKNGYARIVRSYECLDCSGCPVKTECTRSKKNRAIERSPNLIAYRKEARERFATEEGDRLRRKRGHACETFFGHMKRNLNIRRFLLRGLEKVKTEALWIAIAYNLARAAARGWGRMRTQEA